MAARFQRYDWPTESLAEWHDIRPGGIVIFEGTTALHLDLIGNFDLTIWIDMSQAVASKRGIERDLYEYKIDTTAQWEKEWKPMELEYVAENEPYNKAHFIIRP